MINTTIARIHSMTLVAGYLAAAAAVLTGCAGQQTSDEIARLQQQGQTRSETLTINRKLAVAASRQSAVSTRYVVEEYRVGFGDVLDVAVFQVDELNRKVRVNGNGKIMIPLLGLLDVGGKTAGEVEKLLARRLEEKYLNNPQVSVFVEEYRSQQITVMGAVNKPSVYSVRQPRTLLEMLSQAGGLTAEAGNKLYVQTVQPDPVTARPVPQSMILGVKQLLESNDPRFNVVLRGGDSIYVPKAGVVFVEGSVRKPGAYSLTGEANVLKVVAMAGGTSFEAAEGSIQVFRQDALGNQVLEVDLRAVRNNNGADISLQDGDIIVVKSNILKSGFAGFWRGFTGLFSFSRGI